MAGRGRRLARAQGRRHPYFLLLDNCIEAMRETGREMSAKFKETSLGDLAVNMPQC